jgi:hypothetical protein
VRQEEKTEAATPQKEISRASVQPFKARDCLPSVEISLTPDFSQVVKYGPGFPNRFNGFAGSNRRAVPMRISKLTSYGRAT